MDSFSDIRMGILVLVLTALAIILTVTIYVKLGFDRSLFDRMILSNKDSSTRGYNSKTNYDNLVGKSGLSKSILRPTGRIEINGNIYDAKSESDFISKDRNILVTRIKNGNIIVKEIA